MTSALFRVGTPPLVAKGRSSNETEGWDQSVDLGQSQNATDGGNNP